MEAIEISFGRWRYQSFGAARRACEQRLSRYKAGQFIGGEDRDFFLTLLKERYPYYVESFFGDDLDPDLADDPSLQMVDWSAYTTPIKKGKGLRAIREDGSWRAVSWRRCVEGCTHTSWVIAAARLHVMAQHRAFLSNRLGRIGNVSDISGLTREKIIVDYPIEQTLYSLVREWLDAEKMSFTDIALDKNRVEFAHFDVAESWQEYHRAHARLRAVTQFERSPYEA